MEIEFSLFSLHFLSSCNRKSKYLVNCSKCWLLSHWKQTRSRLRYFHFSFCKILFISVILRTNGQHYFTMCRDHTNLKYHLRQIYCYVVLYTAAFTTITIITALTTIITITWRNVSPRYCFSAIARWPRVTPGRLVSVATTLDSCPLEIKRQKNLSIKQHMKRTN